MKPRLIILVINSYMTPSHTLSSVFSVKKETLKPQRKHYSDVIMSVMASQITGVSIFCFNRFLRRRSKRTSKLRVIGLCEGNMPVTSGFPSHRASNAENASIWWRRYETRQFQNLANSIYQCHCYIEAMVVPYCSCQKPGLRVSKYRVKSNKDSLMCLLIRCRLGWQPIGSQLLKILGSLHAFWFENFFVTRPQDLTVLNRTWYMKKL